MQRSSNRRSMLVRLGCVAAAVGAATLLAGAGAANAVPADPPAPQASFSFVSTAGDYVGDGQTKSFQSPATVITASGNTNQITISIHSPDYSEEWSAILAAPVGQPLYPGTYLNAERASSRTGRAPGLDVSGDGHGCGDVYGQFTVYQVAFDSSGNLSTLEASFQQHCGLPTTPPLSGTIRYNALPLSYQFASDPDDYIGAGQTRTYYNDTSVISVRGNAHVVQMQVSGLGNDWFMLLGAPIGQTFQAGQTYPTQGANSAAYAGLRVYGDGRTCGTFTGSLTIDDLVTDADGNITNLAVSFTQHCDGATGALNGDLRYLDGSWYPGQGG